jgi:hypothetical protein
MFGDFGEFLEIGEDICKVVRIFGERRGYLEIGVDARRLAIRKLAQLIGHAVDILNMVNQIMNHPNATLKALLVEFTALAFFDLFDCFGTLSGSEFVKMLRAIKTQAWYDSDVHTNVEPRNLKLIFAGDRGMFHSDDNPYEPNSPRNPMKMPRFELVSHELHLSAVRRRSATKNSLNQFYTKSQLCTKLRVTEITLRRISWQVVTSQVCVTPLSRT